MAYHQSEVKSAKAGFGPLSNIGGAVQEFSMLKNQGRSFARQRELALTGILKRGQREGTKTS